MSLVQEPLPRSKTTTWAELGRRLLNFGRPPRLSGIDVARGLAIFGMIGAHTVFAAADFSWTDPSSWVALVHGRPALLFAVVAGVSVALAAGAKTIPRGEALRSARLRMAGRALVVLTIGVALEMLGTGLQVILPVYGVLFLVIIPFLGLRRRTLVVTAAVLALAGPTLMIGLRILALNQSGPGADLLIWGTYPLTVWLPLVLAGIALGRSSLNELRTVTVVLIIGIALTVVGYGVGGLVNPTDSGTDDTASISGALTSSGCNDATGGYDCTTGTDSTKLIEPDKVTPAGDYLERLTEVNLPLALRTAWSVAPHSSGSLEIIGSGGFAIAIIGACLLIARRARVLLIPIAAVGSMPLTAYTAHVASFVFITSPIGFLPQLYSTDDSTGYLIWGASVATLIVGCTIWVLTKGSGPLERLTAWAAHKVDNPT